MDVGDDDPSMNHRDELGRHVYEALNKMSRRFHCNRLGGSRFDSSRRLPFLASALIDGLICKLICLRRSGSTQDAVDADPSAGVN
jgi:hypothetical protein